MIAQLGWPDMRLPILYAMSWPHRVKVDYGRGIDEKFDFVKLASMSFKVCPCLGALSLMALPHTSSYTRRCTEWVRREPWSCGAGPALVGGPQLIVACSCCLTQAPDYEKYPCIPLAYEAGRRAGSMTCALNAANEKANELFRAGSFDFFGIPKVIEATMAAHEKDFKTDPTLEDIIATDEWARAHVEKEAARLASAPILL